MSTDDDETTTYETGPLPRMEDRCTDTGSVGRCTRPAGHGPDEWHRNGEWSWQTLPNPDPRPPRVETAPDPEVEAIVDDMAPCVGTYRDAAERANARRLVEAGARQAYEACARMAEEEADSWQDGASNASTCLILAQRFRARGGTR